MTGSDFFVYSRLFLLLLFSFVSSFSLLSFLFFLVFYFFDGKIAVVVLYNATDATQVINSTQYLKIRRILLLKLHTSPQNTSKIRRILLIKIAHVTSKRL